MLLHRPPFKQAPDLREILLTALAESSHLTDSRQDTTGSIQPMSIPLKVYVKPGCPWCVDVLADLRATGYKFEEINVIADRNAFAEMKRLSGQTLAPTVTFGELILPDCGVPELRAFLKKHEIRP